MSIVPSFCSLNGAPPHHRGRKDRKPNPLKRPLQQISKVIVVFDYQDGDGTMVGRFEAKPLVR